jgi:hypothetical protein
VIPLSYFQAVPGNFRSLFTIFLLAVCAKQRKEKDGEKLQQLSSAIE